MNLRSRGEGRLAAGSVECIASISYPLQSAHLGGGYHM